MAEQTNQQSPSPFTPQVRAEVDVDLGSSYQDFLRQVQVSSDEELVNEAFESIKLPDAPVAPEVDPKGFDFQGGAEPGGEVNDKNSDGNGFLKTATDALGIAQQILVGGGLDAANNTAEFVTKTGEQVRNFEIGGATVEQHLQSIDESLGTGKLFSGKVEVGIGTLEKEGGAAVQMARGLTAWLVGFAALKGGGAATIPAGIAADGLAIDRDANLSNLFNDTFPEDHPLRNPLMDALAASKDDTELEKSVKSMIEGFGLTLPFTAIQAISKSLSSFKKSRVKAKQAIKDSGGNPEPGFASGFDSGADVPFKQWFEGSKVVDEAGSPMVVYHGTNKDFQQFNLSEKSGVLPDTESFEAVFFTSNPTQAGSLASLGRGMEGVNVRPAYVNLKNPMVIDSVQEYGNVTGRKKLIKRAKALGHDGVIIKATLDRAEDGVEKLTHVIAFNEKQIRSIFKKNPPPRPKVSAVFDGKEYNITDMELRFDDVNSQKAIDKAQTKFDEIVEKVKKDPSKGKNKKGRDVRTLAETESQARKELQADPEGQLKELMEKDPTTTITDKDRFKMALFQEASVRKLIELRNAFSAGDSTAVQKAFDQGVFTADLFEQAQRFSETASRDLGSGRLLKQLKRTEGNIIVDKFDVVRRDIDPNVSPESFMRKLGSIEGATDSAIEKMMSKVFGETVRLGGFDMFFEAWVNSLFGFKTQVVNALGSVLNMGFQVSETQIAAGIRGVKRAFGATGKGVEQGEAFEMLYGIMMSAPENVRAISKNITNVATGREVTTSKFNKLDASGVRAIRGDNVPAFAALKESGSGVGNVLYQGVDIIGHILTVQGKGLLTVDEAFKFAAYNAAKRRLAYRTAVEEGITDKTLRELRIRQLVNEPSASLKAEAEEFARIATFTNEAGEVGQAFQALLKSAPAAKIIVPFFNVLNNIAKFTGSRTPLAVFSKNVRADLAAGGVRADMAQARLASGAMAALGFLALAMGGGLVGSEPTHPAHRESFRRKKKQPFSMEFRHEDGSRTSVSINRLEPAAFFAVVMADFVKISGELEEGEIDTFVGAYVLAISKHFFSQTFATGISDFMNLAMEGDKKFLKNLGSSMLPFNGIMSDIEKTIDPALRDTKTFDRTIFEDALVEQYGENEGKAIANSLEDLTQVLARLKSRIPEFSETLPARLDAFGEVITTEYGFENPIINTLNPFATNTIVPNSLEDWITQLKANIVTPDPQIEGVKLTPEEFHDWKKLGGQAAKKKLLQGIARPEWEGTKDFIKKAKLELWFKHEYDRAARKMLSRSDPILDKETNSLKYFNLIKAVEKEREKSSQKGRDDRSQITTQPTDF